MKAWLDLLGWLALALLLRWFWATAVGGEVADWEADAFVRLWEGQALESGPVRPIGAALAWSATGWRTTDVVSTRALAACVSLVAVLACALLGGALAPPGSARKARLWALALSGLCLPTVFMASVRPTPDVWVGAAWCSLVAAGARWAAVGGVRLGILTMLASAAVVALQGWTGAVGLLCGWLALALPLPRVGRVLAVGAVLVAAVLLGGVLPAAAARSADSLPRWLLDTAPVHGLRGLLPESQTVALVGEDLAFDLAWAEAVTTEATWEALQAAGPATVLHGLARRVAVDLLGWQRFLEAGASDNAARGMLLLECALRGALAVLAVRVWGSMGRGRAALAGALVGALVVSSASATSPHALAWLDLVLAGLASAALAGMVGAQRRSLGLSCLLAAALHVGIGLWAWSCAGPSTLPRHAEGEASLLVATLVDGGPRGSEGHQIAASLLMSPTAPLLRMPGPALRHAELGAALDPWGVTATEVLVRALVENGRLDEARQVAEDAWLASDKGSRRARVIVEWVEHVASLRRRQQSQRRRGLRSGARAGA